MGEGIQASLLTSTWPPAGSGLSPQQDLKAVHRAVAGLRPGQLLSSNSARIRLPTGTRSAVRRSHRATTISMP